MSASPVDVDRKIRQLDNEVQAIYEMLARIEGTQRRHDNRFEEIGADLTALDRKVTTLDQKVTTLDGKVTALDEKLDRVIGLLER